MKKHYLGLLFSILFASPITIKLVLPGADLQDPRNFSIEKEFPGFEALIRAIKMGDVESVKTIYESAPESVEQEDDRGEVALHYAAESRHSKVLKIITYLLSETEAYRTINVTNKSGNTPLDFAHWYGTRGVENYLMECGAMRGIKIRSSCYKKLNFDDTNETELKNDPEEELSTDDDEEEEDYEDDDYNGDGIEDSDNEHCDKELDASKESEDYFDDLFDKIFG